MHKKMNNKGFSLVELIIVIMIMAILVGVLTPQFVKYVEKTRESTDLQNIEEMKAAIEALVAEKEVASGKEFKISVASNTITVSDEGSAITDFATELGKYGLKASIPTKSKSWDNFAWSYNASGTPFQWACADADTKGATYFYISGKAK